MFKDIQRYSKIFQRYSENMKNLKKSSGYWKKPRQLRVSKLSRVSEELRLFPKTWSILGISELPLNNSETILKNFKETKFWALFPKSSESLDTLNYLKDFRLLGESLVSLKDLWSGVFFLMLRGSVVDWTRRFCFILSSSNIFYSPSTCSL